MDRRSTRLGPASYLLMAVMNLGVLKAPVESPVFQFSMDSKTVSGRDICERLIRVAWVRKMSHSTPAGDDQMKGLSDLKMKLNTNFGQRVGR